MSALQLSPSTYLYPPSPEESLASNASHPHAVVLATWAFAQDNHIAKYVDQYRARFPGTCIFVAKCFLRHFFWHPGARMDLEALTSTIRSILDTGEDQASTVIQKSMQPKLLLHIFSNGGISTAYNLLNVYMAGDKSHRPFPEHVTIFDSTPGRYEYWSVVSALQFSIPGGYLVQKLVSVPLAHMLSSSLWIWCRIFQGEDWIARWRHALNDPARVLETCRSYAYSRADLLVESWAVEAHAEDARKQGFTVVHTADFGDKSAHVAHSRTDPTRYWTLVMNTWEYARTGRQQ